MKHERGVLVFRHTAWVVGVAVRNQCATDCHIGMAVG